MIQEVLLPVIIVFIIIGLPVIGGTLISLAKIIKGDSGGHRKGNRSSSSDETQLIQDIHRTLSRLEDRIDALETIVINNSSNQK